MYFHFTFGKLAEIQRIDILNNTEKERNIMNITRDQMIHPLFVSLFIVNYLLDMTRFSIIIISIFYYYLLLFVLLFYYFILLLFALFAFFNFRLTRMLELPKASKLRQ